MLYTRTGDEGYTSLADGTRVPKTHVRIEAVGSADELNAHLGLLLAALHASADQLPGMPLAAEVTLLHRAQHLLFALGAACAGVTDPEGAPRPDDTADLEHAIDAIATVTGRLFTGFVLPGGHAAAAQCHVCRAVCRRMERDMLRCGMQEWDGGEGMLAYVNRLSDFLYALVKKINFLTDNEEIRA